MIAEPELSTPIRSIASRNFCRSSAFSIAAALAPISSDPQPLERAVLEQRQRGVQRGLPAHRRQQRVGRSASMILATISGVTSWI